MIPLVKVTVRRVVRESDAIQRHEKCPFRVARSVFVNKLQEPSHRVENLWSCHLHSGAACSVRCASSASSPRVPSVGFRAEPGANSCTEERADRSNTQPNEDPAV